MINEWKTFPKEIPNWVCGLSFKKRNFFSTSVLFMLSLARHESKKQLGKSTTNPFVGIMGLCKVHWNPLVKVWVDPFIN